MGFIMASILQLDIGGQPVKWLGWQDAVVYHAKGLVAWELGEVEHIALGGFSALTGERSRIITSSIMAVKGAMSKKKMARPPSLSNRVLFQRDQHLCAYCGKTYGDSRLTRDHIMPQSLGGKDTWTNCVTCCAKCNQAKDNMTLDECGMQLLYVPYVPNHAEALILSNRNVRADQMEFLLGFVPEHSRIRAQLS